MSEEPRTKDPSGQASQVETTVHYSVLIDFYWENVFFPNIVSISVCIEVRVDSGRAALVAGVMLIRNDNLAAPLPSLLVMVRDSGVSDQ